MNTKILNIDDLKKQLSEQRAKIIIHGRTRTGKTELFNKLVPEEWIIHSEKVINVDKSSNLSFDCINNARYFGIDEAHYVDKKSLHECIQYVRSNKMGIVIVCQDLDTHPLPKILDQLLDATFIDSDNIDLRNSVSNIFKLDPNRISHNFTIGRTSDGMSGPNIS